MSFPEKRALTPTSISREAKQFLGETLGKDEYHWAVETQISQESDVRDRLLYETPQRHLSALGRHVVMEMRALGCPMVVSFDGGTWDQMENGDDVFYSHGYIIPLDHILQAKATA